MLESAEVVIILLAVILVKILFQISIFVADNRVSATISIKTPSFIIKSDSGFYLIIISIEANIIDDDIIQNKSV